MPVSPSPVQCCADKCLTVDSLEDEEPWFIACAHFCGINTPTVATFRLVTLTSPSTELGRHVHIGSRELLGASWLQHTLVPSSELQLNQSRLWPGHQDVFRNAPGDSSVKHSLRSTAVEYVWNKLVNQIPITQSWAKYFLLFRFHPFHTMTEASSVGKPLIFKPEQKLCKNVMYFSKFSSQKMFV